MSEVEILATKEYMKKKWGPVFLVTPLFSYSLLSTINNLFGVDLTSGWMGKRDPVGAGYLVLATSPIFVYLIAKGIREYFFQVPPYLSVSQEALVLHQGPIGKRLRIVWKSIIAVRFEGVGASEQLVLDIKSAKPQKIKLTYIDITKRELSDVLSQHLGQV